MGSDDARRPDPGGLPPPSPEPILALCCAGWSCCGWLSSPSCGLSNWEPIRSVADSGQDPWWRRAVMKVREWSEIIAGPRWKTFIRRFNRGGGIRRAQFQYDPLSYALNFDEGTEDLDSESGHSYRNFSARFAGPTSAKCSMDLGGRDAPSVVGDGNAFSGHLIPGFSSNA
ncbi:hypothetical protein J5N97_006591 [Dioscorea zingiberensis]|uniref:NHL repeat-containing protein n=1 Tax=Dioscorea zingiberensis TaxID=325984 RepID=A0A9D5DA74_9LILI|nr:hypothetical protein J5N97_006591 [Dioscorea zingiberensis]